MRGKYTGESGKERGVIDGYIMKLQVDFVAMSYECIVLYVKVGTLCFKQIILQFLSHRVHSDY